MNQTGVTKMSINKQIMSFLYAPAMKKISEKLDLIAYSFALKSKNNEPAFMYKGGIYCSEGFRPVRGHKVELLSKSFYDQMDKWLEEEQDIKSEESQIQGFISCALIEANSVAELKELLPSCLHPAISHNEIFYHSFKIAPEAVALFHQTHTHHIQKIKERVVLNMIT